MKKFMNHYFFILRKKDSSSEKRFELLMNSFLSSLGNQVNTYSILDCFMLNQFGRIVLVRLHTMRTNEFQYCFYWFKSIRFGLLQKSLTTLYRICRRFV